MTAVIQEYIKLPSLGKLYIPEIDPNITIRAAKTSEEKKRLSYANNMTYKILSEIIDACILTDLKMSSYDMAIGDFQYLLYKYRTVSYGNIYPVQTISPFTGKPVAVDVDLDDLEIYEYGDGFEEQLTVNLPMSKDIVTLRMLTPRALDDISVREAEILKKNPNALKPSFDLTLKHLIKTVNGQELNPAQLEKYIKELYVRDANIILDTHDNIKLGINQEVIATCPDTGQMFEFNMPITGEFLRPNSYR